MSIQTIDIIALEWFDNVNGNSYFAGTITLNFGMSDEKRLVMPFQYGYSDCYIDRAKDLLKKNNILDIKDAFCRLPQYCRENNIVLRYTKHENCKKRELTSIK